MRCRIWLQRGIVEIELYQKLAQVDDVHWLHVYRRRLISNLLSDVQLPRGRGLDVGCGVGGNLGVLKKYCSAVVGLDASEVAIDFARQKSADVIFQCADANRLSQIFPDDKFSLITYINVLYHQWIKDEHDVLKQTSDLLMPRGCVVIVEPAFKILSRKFDRLNMGKGRYRTTHFEKICRDVGLKVIKKTYFNAPSFFPLLLLKYWEMFQNKDAHAHGTGQELQLPNPKINETLIKILEFEGNIIRRICPLPVGVSLLVIAQKI